MARDPNVEIKIAFALATIGGGLLLSGIRRMRQVRRVQDAGSIPIASAPQGLVELQGFAWPIKPLISPFNGQQCVYWRLKIEEERPSGKNRRWVTVYEVSTSETFFLADETGHVLMFPEMAEFDLREQKTDWDSLSNEQRDRLLLLAQEKTLFFKDTRGLGIFSIKKRIRVTHACLPVGAPLYALGSLRTVASNAIDRPAVGLSVFFHNVKLLKNNHIRMQQVLDADKDGRVGFDEWYVGYNRTAIAAGGGFSGDAPLVLPRGMENTSICHGMMAHDRVQKLFLADCHQEELLHRLGSWNLVRIIGGALAIAVGAAVIFQKFFR